MTAAHLPASAPVQPSPPSGPAATAQRILNQPTAAVAIGPRPIERRRPVPAWRRLLFIVAPLVTVPAKAGTTVVLGSVLLGAAASAVVPGWNLNAGVAHGIMGATLLTAPTLAIASFVGVVRMAGRTRQDLSQILHQRRQAKAAKQQKNHNRIARLKKGLFR